MIKRISKLVLFLVLVFAGSASSRAQREGFIPVEGANLKSKLDLAVKQGRTKQTRFWTAYSFDVRPGVAVECWRDAA